MKNQMIELTMTDVEGLTKAIQEHVRTPRDAQARDAQTSFCSIWPQAKAALEILLTFIGTIPGVGIFAKVAIGVVVAAGDAASSALCK